MHFGLNELIMNDGDQSSIAQEFDGLAGFVLHLCFSPICCWFSACDDSQLCVSVCVYM